jgi:translation elongation factor EF-1alpha
MDSFSQNLNIAVIGNVSVGKSTINNLIIGKELSETSIECNTISPIVFVENQFKIEIKIDDKSIFNKIKENNESNKTNQELIFDIDKLDINIIDNIGINLFDIPGLNHFSENADYDYIITNFSKFNIILYIIDIHNNLNTINDSNMLNLIGEHIKINKSNNKDTYIMFIFNKADDMQLVKNDQTNKEELHLDESLKTLFNKSIQFIGNEFSKYGILENIIGFIPLCALDAFLYRMMLKNGNQYL